MPFFQAPDGTPLFFHDWGTGRPVVLLHGWPLNADSWEYQSVPLAEAGFRVIAPDRRGFGRSGQPWEGYDYDTLAGDVTALLEHLDLHDVVLAGFSMGGGEVARVAGSGNPRIAKAAFLAAVTPFMLKTDNHDGADASVFEGMVSGLRDDRPSFFKSFVKMFYGHTLLGRAAVPEPVLEHFMEMALMASPRATIECVKAFGHTDFRGDLARLTVPTLIIHGTSDATVPPDISGRATAKLLPHARFIEYDGSPHGLLYTDRVRAAEDLIAFAR
jgi:pimeloyl-ACP methyl ester carboxylesterase